MNSYRTPVEIQLPAVEVRQTPNRRLYTFAIDGKQLHQVAAVSRLRRDGLTSLFGYQRPEVRAHISAIRNYIESSDPVLPNAIVVAFDRRVKFKPVGASMRRAFSRLGILTIPIDPTWREIEKPGWIVDGQQRAAAIRESALRRFPVCVTAFITASQGEQRAQFLLVNSTKPLPKGLVYELLPATEAVLPRALKRRRLPAVLLERLNHDNDSPLRKLIRTPTNPEGIIKDNSILRMLDNSLSDGGLYSLKETGSGLPDVQAMVKTIKDFWRAVSLIFPEAFGKPPRHSRLMHGVGVVSMGFVMDAIIERYPDHALPTMVQYRQGIQAIASYCRWTKGSWHFGRQTREWNDLENTPHDIRLLTDFLLSRYQKSVTAERTTPKGGRQPTRRGNR